LTELSERIAAVIKKIPEGKVASYGQIARLAGNPGAARRVAWLLHSSSGTRGLPWQRVESAQGKISFPWGSASFNRQARRLRSEGIEIGARGEIDLATFLWKPKRHP
jgi:methylated-DNA-protein-cysteine methyltransferase-like protein